MAIMVYSPGVQCIISCKAGQIDISDDITGGNITIAENAPSTMTLNLLNKRRKYDRLFAPNDRFVIYLKRITKLLTITGYLDTVPYFTVWPRSIQIAGTSTIKRIQYHWWDPGTQAATILLSSQPDQSNPATASPDGGLAQKARDVLVQVGGWPIEQIHFGAIPPDWLNKITSLYNAVDARSGVAWASLGGGPLLNGGSPLDALTTVQRADAPDGGAGFPNSFPTAIHYTGPQDIKSFASTDYFCQMQWGYNATGANFNVAADKQWLAQRHILVVNPNNNKSVLCGVAGLGPSAGSTGQIGLSDAAYNYLNIVEPQNVSVAWMADPNLEAGQQLGPYNPSTGNNPQVKKTLNKAGEQTGSPNPGNLPPSAIAAGQTPSTGATAAVNYCLRQVGKPYVWGGGRPIDGKDKANYDCSSLVANGWFAAGVGAFSSLSTTVTQWSGAGSSGNTLQNVSQNAMQPGDLIYYHPDAQGFPGHVKMYIGNGNTVEAPHTGANVFTGPLDTNGLMGVKRVTNQPANSGQINAGGGAGTNPQGPPLITIWDWYGQSPDPLSELLDGPRAMMNDTPLLPEITMMVNASMRNWANAPNGDFIAWFPDYFGAYGTAGKMEIADVEVQDFSIVWSDIHLYTHMFTAGTWGPDPFSPTPGGPVGYNEMITTKGIATVDFPEILQALFNLSPADASRDKILKRFGARPYYQAMGQVGSASMAEFWYALFMFQKNWAEQFNALVHLTFMPELYPGMLLQIPSQKFQAYITQVSHSFDLSDGGGFRTDVNIVAPATTESGGGLWGLPRGGLGALL